MVQQKISGGGTSYEEKEFVIWMLSKSKKSSSEGKEGFQSHIMWTATT